MFFDFLKKYISGQFSNKPKDLRKAECPSCHGALKKIPGAKTRCPHCGEYMFVRTRVDGIRLVVDKDGADKIDEQWRIANGTQEAYLNEQKRIEERRKLLRKKFGGKEPSKNDVEWSLLNDEIIYTAGKAQWGLYRNARHDMAEILLKEKKYKEALSMYLVVCYLDLNGASNTYLDYDENGEPDLELYKPFDLETQFLAPGIIARIHKVIKAGGFDKKDVKELFFNSNTREHQAIQTPVAPQDCFNELETEIWNSVS